MTSMNEIKHGDSLEVLEQLEPNSVHAVITDPPYGLAFMGRDWDDFEPKEYQEWCTEWAEKAKQVLKPGGHLLAFSGNRTHHRLFTGVEDAGFEIRDTLTWHYGSGFPKAADVSKTIDKRADAKREVVGEKQYAGGHVQRSDAPRFNGRTHNNGEEYQESKKRPETAPATDAAKKRDGWKTGLKPATEYVVMARKPFDGATVDCVLEHGTGALNIGETRIGTDERTNEPPGDNDVYAQAKGGHGNVEGRYPANVVFDETEAERLDSKIGELSGGARTPQSQTGRNTSDAPTQNDPEERIQLESGGPSRYFYTSKASRSERTHDGAIENDHPTVKPVDLMEWVVRLVTREGQLVLDPFAGSGTTLKAAKALGREFVGIEQQPRYADLARARVGLTVEDPANVRDDADQRGLEAFGGGGR